MQRAGTPSITLLNSTRKPLLVVLTSWPLCAAILRSQGTNRLESHKPRGRHRPAKPALKTSSLPMPAAVGDLLHGRHGHDTAAAAALPGTRPLPCRALNTQEM
jgi:hypothetical protein